jgi:hypothetical protein
MTAADATIVAGIEIPSISQVFLAIVGMHVLAGLACPDSAPACSATDMRALAAALAIVVALTGHALACGDEGHRIGWEGKDFFPSPR